MSTRGVCPTAAAAPGEPLQPGVSARRGQLDFFLFHFFKIFFLNLFALKVIEKTFVFSEFFKTFEKHF
jgi:hypothetical protein